MPRFPTIQLTSSQRLRLPFNKRLRRAYRAFREFPAGNYETLLDIGAHEGAFTSSALALFRPQRIWLVEADPQLAAALRSNFASDSRCKVLHAAISDNSGEVVMRINKHRASSSILPMNAATPSLFGADMAEMEMVRVPSLSLDDLFAREKIDTVDLCKVDIQGAERMMIQGGKEALRRVRWLYIEALFEEYYEGCAQFAELNTLLGSCGFKLNLLHDMRRTVAGDLAYGNALYRNAAIT